MAKEICFFIQTPLTKRDYDRFGVDILQSRGLSVSFLDLTGILNPGYLKNYETKEKSSFKNITVINKWTDVEKYLSEHNIFFGIDLVGATRDSVPLYGIVKKYNVPYASFRANSIPTPARFYKDRDIQFGTKILKFIRHICNLSVFYIMKSLFRRISLALYLRNTEPPKMLLVGGRKWLDKLPREGKDVEIVRCHTMDYDLYLRYGFERSGRQSKLDSIVFLDEYSPFHPDFLISGNIKYSLNPDSYYNGLNDFFSRIEKETGLTVKIAAHPSARYELHPDYFAGRQVISGRTIELVYDSKIVLAHASTSINFAVLYRKPIIFLISDEISRTTYASSIRTVAALFKKEPVNVDRDININLSSYTKIDENAYSSYRVDYIKMPGSPEKPFWDIVADEVLEKGKLNGQR